MTTALRLFSGCVFLLCLSSAGCSVVSGAPSSTRDAYLELGRWKDGASKNTDKPSYANVRREVNVWIEAKAKEVEMAGTQWFSQVDLSRPKDLRDKVTSVIGTQESAWTDILDWLVKKYKDGRTAEASSTSAGLRDYLWPEPKAK